jgi:hypothetical protein
MKVFAEKVLLVTGSVALVAVGTGIVSFSAGESAENSAFVVANHSRVTRLRFQDLT